MTDLACTVCKSTSVRPRMRASGFDIYECEVCSHRFVPAHLLNENLDKHYGEQYFKNGAEDGHGYEDYLAKSDKRSRAFNDRLDWIEQRCRRGSILDYGCAVGLFVKVAADRGWRARGYERSAWAAEYGRTKLGVEIEQGSGHTDPFQAASFDAVTMWDVMEHVEHPQQSIALVQRWLKPGGLLAITTVNASSMAARLARTTWRHLLPPHHLQYFTRKSLERLLEMHGFDIVEIRACGTFLRSGKGALASGRLPRLVDGAVTHWHLRRVASALNLLDEVEVLARKR